MRVVSLTEGTTDWKQMQQSQPHSLALQLLCGVMVSALSVESKAQTQVNGNFCLAGISQPSF